MKIATQLPYKKHVLVCCNERIDGRDCCANVCGKDIFLELKRWVIENNLTTDIWVTKTGCLGFCNSIGTTVVVYPDKRWFLETRMDDVENIKKFILDSLSLSLLSN